MSYWYDNAIIYHIYPIGFCGAPKFNEGGDTVYRLDKIYDWIPHLKEMNIGAVYFGPVFESVEHGYDTTDYKKVDRRLGDNQSFRKICKALHENGIKVVLDGVFNHVGREFPQFKDVREKRESSRYCGWFNNLNFGGNTPCNDGFYYDSWNGCFNLVKLNLKNPEVLDYIMEIVDFWMTEFDIDGIRFDAADCMDFDFFKRVRSFCKGKKSDFWLMGEVIHGDYSRWANNDMLDSITNYECYKGLYSSHNDRNYFEIDYSINRQSGEWGIYKNINLYTFVDNHDVSRIGSIIRTKSLLKNVYTMLYCMPGIPSIYYGSEFGIDGRKENGDDDLRPCLDLNNIPNADNDLYAYIVRLGQIYSALKPLQNGKYNTIIIKNQQIVFKREFDGECVFVALNLEDKESQLRFDVGVTEINEVISGQKIRMSDTWIDVKMPPFSCMIFTEIDIPDEIHDDNVSDDVVEVPTAKQPPKTGERYIVGGRECEFMAMAREIKTGTETAVFRDTENSTIWCMSMQEFMDEMR